MEELKDNRAKLLSELGENSKAWPFVEAQRILKRLQNNNTVKDYVLFWLNSFWPQHISPLNITKKMRR